MTALRVEKKNHISFVFVFMCVYVYVYVCVWVGGWVGECVGVWISVREWVGGWVSILGTSRGCEVRILYPPLPKQPGECPLVVEVTTDEGASNDALHVTTVLPEEPSRPHSCSTGPVCFW